MDEYELLTQIVRKNKMYVEWKTTPVTNVNYELIKLRFKSYEKDVRFTIQEAKTSSLIEYLILTNLTLKRPG